MNMVVEAPWEFPVEVRYILDWVVVVDAAVTVFFVSYLPSVVLAGL